MLSKKEAATEALFADKLEAHKLRAEALTKSLLAQYYINQVEAASHHKDDPGRVGRLYLKLSNRQAAVEAAIKRTQTFGQLLDVLEGPSTVLTEDGLLKGTSREVRKLADIIKKLSHDRLRQQKYWTRRRAPLPLLNDVTATDTPSTDDSARELHKLPRLL